nr:EOG090X0ILG [Eulimnadia texana]
MSFDQQWEPVVIKKKIPKGTSSKSEAVVNAARRQGVAVESQLKYGAAKNKHPVTTLNTAKLDQETEELKHDKISLDVGKLIMKGRQDKGLTQKDLATKINEKPQVINDYENGRGFPTRQFLAKLRGVLRGHMNTFMRASRTRLRYKRQGWGLQFSHSHSFVVCFKKFFFYLSNFNLILT